MSHPRTVRHALWDGLRTVYRKVRKVVASSEEHDGRALVAAATIEDLQAVLGRHYFAPNWEFSYHERGEDLNLARIEYDRREASGHEYVWWQTHVRGWTQGDGSVRLRSHFELEPTEYDRDHIAGIGVDVAAGNETVARVLDGVDVPYERFDDLPAGGRR